MAYWLMKSEPDVFSWTDLTNKPVEEWHGVRNYAARNHMKAMKIGDLAFFYHSNVGKEVVGIMRVVGLAHPDSTAELKNGKVVWECVDVVAHQPLPQPVSIEDVKAQGYDPHQQVPPLGAAGHHRGVGSRLQAGRDRQATQGGIEWPC